MRTILPLVLFIAALAAGCAVEPFQKGDGKAGAAQATAPKPGGAGAGPAVSAPVPETAAAGPEAAPEAETLPPPPPPRERPKVPAAKLSPASQALVVGQSLLDNLREVEPVGRLVIDLPKIVDATPGSHDDVVVKGGDRLLVPGQLQEVTVLGEVQSTTSHLWDPQLSRNDYIRMSGGTTQNADTRRIYVVRANGSVVSGRSSAWFRSADGAIRPGDTVVVPLDAQRMRPLPMWTSITTIIYNLAVAVAAINSF
jgi:hypothetical protein